MLKMFKPKKKKWYYLYDDELYFFLRDNLHFLLDKEYSFDDVEYALQESHDKFWNLLNELNKEN